MVHRPVDRKRPLPTTGKWDKLMHYLQALDIPKRGSIKLPITQLEKIVGGLSVQTNRRISYWDPFMGRKTLNPGAAALRAGFVVVQFDYEPDRDMPRIVAITLLRYR